MGIKLIKKQSTWVQAFKAYLNSEFEKLNRTRTDKDKIKEAIMIERQRYARRKIGSAMSLKRRANIANRISGLRSRLQQTNP